MRLPDRFGNVTAWATCRCNLACDYCYVYKLHPNQPKDDMDEETIRALLEFAKNHMIKPAEIWWFGGEPTVVWKDVLVRAVEIAEEMGLRIGWTPQHDVKFGFTTNATLLDEAKVEFMKRYQFGVLISIDGVEEKHDKHRKYHDGRGTFKEVWRAIQLVRKHLNPNPQLRWTVSPDNLDGLADDIKWFVEQGLTALACDPVYECKWYEEDYEKFRREMIKLRGYMIQWARRGVLPFILSVRKASEVWLAMNRGWSWTDRCGLAQGGIGLDVNGDIYPCHRFVDTHDPTLVLGNVKTGIDQEKRIRLNVYWRECRPYCEDPSMCFECLYRPACNGGCLAINWDLFGDMHVVPESYCRIANIAVEVFTPFHNLMVWEGNEAYRRTYLNVRL